MEQSWLLSCRRTFSNCQICRCKTWKIAHFWTTLGICLRATVNHSTSHSLIYYQNSWSCRFQWSLWSSYTSSFSNGDLSLHINTLFHQNSVSKRNGSQPNAFSILFPSAVLYSVLEHPIFFWKMGRFAFSLSDYPNASKRFWIYQSISYRVIPRS